MELTQVKSILHQTEVGEMLMDGMGFSEPILSLKDGKLIDNFFVYLANKKTCTVSGPIAKIGLLADTSEIAYLISCEDQPFSLLPQDTMAITYPSLLAEDYAHYGCLYAKVREVAYKSDCSESEKQTIAEYMAALEKIIAPAMMKLYEEMTPSFFAWVRSQQT
jgi:hypothetical protein